MFWLLMLVSNLFGSDVAKLADDDWGVREAAQYRLRLWGPLALPAVLDAKRSDDPEVRHRANELAAPWLAWFADLRAAAVLLDPWPVNRTRFWLDTELRYHVRRLAIAGGASEHQANWLTPDDEFNAFWWGWTKEGWAADGLYRIRDEIGVRVPWWARLLQ